MCTPTSYAGWDPSSCSHLCVSVCSSHTDITTMSSWVTKRLIKAVLKWTVGPFLASEITSDQLDVAFSQGVVSFKELVLKAEVRHPIVTKILASWPCYRPEDVPVPVNPLPRLNTDHQWAREHLACVLEAWEHQGGHCALPIADEYLI